MKNYSPGISLSDLNVPVPTIMDIVDILIVSILIYNLMVWFKETRAWTLFKGILVVLVFSIFAVILRLNTILWILKNTLSVALIAIMVIFQPELRKALEQLGKGKFRLPFRADKKKTPNCSRKTFDEIVKAIEFMSSNKTGALILIEQDVALGDFEHTGIAIDALVSSQLIINIFEHNTPLHDGAMIIKNNRIAAATCFLPLTGEKLSMDLGTRHRAAFGACEVSDAFVIVVSEETGAISVAHNSKLFRKIPAHQTKTMFFGGDDVIEKKNRAKLWKGRVKHER